MVTNPEDSVGLPYAHGSLPKHVDALRKQAENPQLPPESRGEKAIPMQDVIFQRKHVTLLNKALRDPSHRLRAAALELMHGFTRAAEREEKTRTLNQAAKEYGIPQKNLSEWVAKGIIPYEDRDEYAIYIRRDILDKVAPVYHQAKERGKLAAPLLREMHDELFPESSINPRK
jgi:hypothetical protein